MTQHIQRLLILVLFILHMKYLFFSIPSLLYSNSSLYLHRYLLIVFCKFNQFVFNLGVYFELFESILSHPFIELLVELYCLWLGHRFWRS